MRRRPSIDASIRFDNEIDIKINESLGIMPQDGSVIMHLFL